MPCFPPPLCARSSVLTPDSSLPVLGAGWAERAVTVTGPFFRLLHTRPSHRLHGGAHDPRLSTSYRPQRGFPRAESKMKCNLVRRLFSSIPPPLASRYIPLESASWEA
ncbi:hypothetical protein ACN47E_002235 [Coniothyrium glycines]